MTMTLTLWLGVLARHDLCHFTCSTRILIAGGGDNLVVVCKTGSQPDRGRCIANRKTESQPQGQMYCESQDRITATEGQMYCESQDKITATQGQMYCESQDRITATRADVL